MARALASAWRRNYSTTRDTKKRRYGPPMINLQPIPCSLRAECSIAS
jgi:hypothetical protein